ncbi:MAG: peptidylprolyl isomerase, partial [Planctomycetota bacterium]|nr:peptidylprolyl isomerase [Planctomycetota bacterium]
MRGIVSASFPAILLICMGPVQAQEAVSPEGVDTAFQVNGVTVSMEEFSRKMQEEYGQTYQDLLITRILVEQEAEKVGLDLAEVDQRVETEIQGYLKNPRFRGDVNALKAQLKFQGVAYEVWKHTIRTRTISKMLIDSTRVPPDEDLRTIFTGDYGKDGVKWRIRHLLSAVNLQASKLFNRDDYQAELPKIETKAFLAAEAAMGRAKAGEDFVSLVMSLSQDPVTATEKLEGDLGTRWQYHGGDFDETVNATPLGGIGGPVKSSRGYHVVKITGDAPADFEAEHILLVTRALAGLPPAEKSAQMDALRQKGMSILEEAMGGKDFAELARVHSEDPRTQPRGGALGVRKMPSQFGPEFDQAITEMNEGEIRGVIESRAGLHIIKLKRKSVLPTVKHILFSTQYHIVRERRIRPLLEQQAMGKIQAALEAVKGGEDFSAVVKRDSDDPSTKKAGGEVKNYRPEQFGKEFHDAVSEMAPGDPPRV